MLRELVCRTEDALENKEEPRKSGGEFKGDRTYRGEIGSWFTEKDCGTG